VAKDYRLILIRFYAASNSIFMNASHQDQLLQLHLQECYCLLLLTYCHGALSLSKAQLSDLSVCWNNLYRKLFHIHRLESVRAFVNGIGKLDFLHLSKLITARFFKQLSHIMLHFAKFFLLHFAAVL